MSQTQSYKRTTISGLAWKFGERIGAQLVSMVVAVILARLMTPDEYGVISLTMIFLSISNVFINTGFGSSLVQKKDADEVDFSSIFYLSIGISFVLYVILFFTAPYIATIFDNELICPVLRVISVDLLLNALASVQSAYVSKKLMFKKFFYATIVGTIISGFVGVFMAYNGFGVWALVAQHLTNSVIDKIMLFLTTGWRPHLCFSWKRVKGLFSFSWKITLSALINTGFNELKSFIIGIRYSPADLAFYNKGKGWPELIATNTDGPINSVLFPVMSAEQDDKKRVKAMTRRSICTSCYIIFPVMMGLAVIAPTFVPVVLTDKWNESIPYMQMMCFTYAFWPIHTTNLSAIKATGRSDLILKLEIVKKVIGLAALLISMWFGVFWLVFSSVIVSTISTVINCWPNKKLLNYSWAEQMRDLLPFLSLSLFMGVPVYMMNYLPWSIYLVLVLQVIVGVIVYVGASFLFKIEPFTYLLSTAKEWVNSKRKK